MAAITPANKVELKIGAHRLILARFTTNSDGDTWSSGLHNVATTPMLIGGWRGDPATQTSGGGNVDYNSTTGVVTFHPSTDSLPLDLLIII